MPCNVHKLFAVGLLAICFGTLVLPGVVPSGSGRYAEPLLANRYPYRGRLTAFYARSKASNVRSGVSYTLPLPYGQWMTERSDRVAPY